MDYRMVINKRIDRSWYFYMVGSMNTFAGKRYNTEAQVRVAKKFHVLNGYTYEIFFDKRLEKYFLKRKIK
jgi:hypothetical protein